jgi:hypothetical protein
MMKIVHRLCAASLIGATIFGACAAVAAEAAQPEPAQSLPKQRAAERPVASADPRIAHAQTNRDATPARSNRVSRVSRQRKPAPYVSGNTNRLRSLRNGSMGAGSARPGAANPSQARANPSPAHASIPTIALRRSAVAPARHSVASGGTIGGARAQANSSLGGPASGKAARPAALNGNEVLRRR